MGCHDHDRDRAEICYSSDSIRNLDFGWLKALLGMDLKVYWNIFHQQLLIDRILAVKIREHYLQLHLLNLLHQDAGIVRKGSWDQQFNDLLTSQSHYECFSVRYQ
jgi:hypothetical protein